jgi:2-dehydropantoate 2-reductase
VDIWGVDWPNPEKRLCLLPEGSQPSMQRDLIAGRLSELSDQNGAVVRLGRERGVPTPINAFLYASLLPQEKRVRGEVGF